MRGRRGGEFEKSVGNGGIALVGSPSVRSVISYFVPNNGANAPTSNMNRRRAFTSEWMFWLGWVCVLVACWAPIIARLSGYSQPLVLGALAALVVALCVLCALIDERNSQLAHVLAQVFLFVPTIALLGLMLWWGVVARTLR